MRKVTVLCCALSLCLLTSCSTPQRQMQHVSYQASVPIVPAQGEPARLLWTSIQPVTEVAVTATGEVESAEVQDVGQLIADFGIYLAETYGNGTGGSPKNFRYNRGASGAFDEDHGYATFQDASNNLASIVSGDLDYMNFSCAAFASFCQKKVLGDLVYYETRCEVLGNNRYASVVHDADGDDGLDYVKEYARPGDILLYPTSSGYAHAELYIGPYADWEYACVGSNMPGRDVYIKPLDSTVYSRHPSVSLVPLSEWLEMNEYTPVVDTTATPEELAREVEQFD